MSAGWLTPAAVALDSAPTPRPVFFRDDDAGWDDPRLYALLDVFEGHGLPVDLAAIPTAVSPSLARELWARAARGAVRIHQHGYAHLDHQRAGRKCEFGADRPVADMAADVLAGRALLLDALGPLVEPVFTPPWNRCSPALADVLVAEGIEVLSRDGSAERLGHPRLAEIPVTVDWFGHRKGVRWAREELARRLAAGIAGEGAVGVMLHHSVTDAAELDAVADLLTLVGGHPNANPTTIIELHEAEIGVSPRPASL